MIGTIGLLGPEARERVARLATAIERAREPGRDGVAPAAGVPLADRPIDHACLAAAVRRVAAVLADAGALSADEVAAIEGHADLEGDLAAVLAWATGRPASPPFEDAAIVWSVLRLALPPFVVPFPPTPRETADRGCPECGMSPDLAILQASGARILVCGACDMEWRADRVRCPFCGNASQDLLGYLAGGGAGLVIRVCDACRTYLKTIDRRVVGGDESPLLLRMLLAEMDLAAAGAGYGPAPGSLR